MDSSDHEPWPLSYTRRRLLQLLPIGLLTVEVGAAFTLPRAGGKPYEDSITLQGITLDVYVSEHDSDTWTQHQERIREVVLQSDVIIPEYFPHEYQQLKQKYPMLKNWDYGNALFDEVANLCRENKKSVWVVDPSYCEDAIFLRAILPIPDAAIWATGFAGLASLLKEKAAETTPNTKPLSRRGLFTIGAVSFLGTFAVGAGRGLSGVAAAESVFRQAMVADQIVNLISSGKLKSGQRVRLMYPDAHWRGNSWIPGIKGFLQDDDLRTKTVDAFRSLFGDALPDLFRIRHYPHGIARDGRPSFARIELGQSSTGLTL